ncbi:tRNA-guanine transglycosylase [Weissella viridescens]|uniref:Queuine tRNA-ribosyltransferase n=1 Tax=Weissella viridescens TaxID=1629 RepID=A0A0R2H275_WEIVI|nr:tRNA guanosine(34) transglycosylase Tgt [Weissella viridescens]KRN45718.1 queuine tRNA-ribosyltransferase [Weissella viridescens]MBX4173514.1 tRNA guanosine(34) transglycosylase Tgt [Weissella viridescens]MCB6840871.1 tRNA guanosine(34) transglycosylase Tgt [Weissella viridescens]MCB6847604.1 tRNA guanosine(34) transglycosylase Tgt [Weissella viridescens]QOD86641.1 tRNA guanosine(34) transglycosylase Tgt [Weissella viridescens]
MAEDYAVKYELLHVEKHTGARLGKITTPHGEVMTPMFMPVGTQATVKNVSTRELREIHSQFILANTYHLWLRPGDELIAQAGGLHKFMDWDGPILTDSGGFQVWSLSQHNKISEEGVTFRNHLNGEKMFLSPEVAMRIQNNLGSDVMMQLDEAIPYFETYDYVKNSVERTSRWAERAMAAHKRPEDQALFGIVQGAGFKQLRKQSANDLVSLDLPGYAVGGLSVGESKEEMNRVLDFTVPWLPENKPRYLMGVAAPDSLVDGVMRGIDMFDCVLPTRIGRNGTLMTKHGRVVITNAKYKNDFSPIDLDLDDYGSTHYTKAYLHHLFNANELLGQNIASVHNLRYLLKLMEDMRQAIAEDRLLDFRAELMENYGYNKKNARLF